MENLSSVDLASALLTIAHDEDVYLTSNMQDALIEAACRLNDLEG